MAIDVIAPDRLSDTGESTVQVVRFEDAAAFLTRAQPFLLQDEAANNFILGTAGRLRDDVPDDGRQDVYLATVEADEGGVVAAALMTPPYSLVLSRVVDAALPGAMIALATDLSHTARTLPGAGGPVPASRAFAEAWTERSGQAILRGRKLRIYQLEAVHPVVGVPGHLRRATTNDRDLLIRWLAAFGAETGEDEPAAAVAARVDALIQVRGAGGLHIWENGRLPCSMAAAVDPTVHGMRVNSVYTPPPLRGHGYASACVAALSQRQLDTGRRFCFLCTDLRNPTSNHIYQQIGYQPLCDVDGYRFAPRAPGETRNAG